MGRVLDRFGQLIARYLERPVAGYEPFTPSDSNALAASLRPGDVLLVEGNNHISGVIKYLTQSTWSHAALFVGTLDGRAAADGEPHMLIEAELGIGVDSAPLSKYSRFHTRVCRPIGLTAEDCERVCRYAVERIGLAYDLKNITDLLRYLMPLPVPQRFRRRALALGSGDPTRIICSALIAQAFESVRYPILPKVTRAESRVARRELLEIRHHSLYAPRDFDISPYFAVVKPTIENGFNYKALHWADLPLRSADEGAEMMPPSVDAGDATLVPASAKRRLRARRRAAA
jgi:Permuted papain-like amidase enzyme, YaeF/YiiX, C92 family